MLTNVEGFISQNSLSSVADGAYGLVDSEYQSLDGRTSATLKEVVVCGSEHAIACDLIVVMPNGDVLFRDFLRMPDNGWRDSYGRRAEELASLLPPELSDMRLCARASRNIAIDNGSVNS